MWKLIESAIEPNYELASDYFQVAFFGRSNVGKSSFINALTNHKRIAYTSKTPGRTQTINYYKNEVKNFLLVDLPGYGYVRGSHSTKNSIMRVINAYTLSLNDNYILFLLIDGKVGFTTLDQEVLKAFKELSLKYILIFTKMDKVNQSELFKLKKSSLAAGIEKSFYISSTKKINLDLVKRYLEQEWKVLI